MRRAARTAAGFLLLCLLPRPALTAVTDVEVKAAFLYNFAKYTQWPPESGAGRAGEFAIVVLGADPFGAVLDDMLRGKSIGERKVVVRRIASPEDVSDARILYIADSEAEQLPRILDRLQGSAVLTVSEMRRFATRGGVVQVKTEGDRVQLEINLHAAERARLKLSSELLKLARIVDPAPGN